MNVNDALINQVDAWSQRGYAYQQAKRVKEQEAMKEVAKNLDVALDALDVAEELVYQHLRRDSHASSLLTQARGRVSTAREALHASWCRRNPVEQSPFMSIQKECERDA